ncbi:RNA-splicing ligase RtcB [Candidatus Woesearchaeota archaeon CG1_02_57_44]|nr:MAG: RNA-splicing ligase RtcB [Candidatus Woesearchaeota archaeon CG1_02_57_44]PIN67843.1 MAG: RNA-splicing ligase RtcB [Candidatus Woesearchaeota archaeon CG11_big_fil_rev_8_21_14_0_20_57_5]
MTIPPMKEVAKNIWEIPASFKQGMLVPAHIVAGKDILDAMDDGVIDQVTNVACMPGILAPALCMPDGHWGYGFPVGGVAAFDLDTGVISPGGIGFDINCGVRLIRTDWTEADVRPKLRELIQTIAKYVPAGVGGEGSVSLTRGQFNDITTYGAQWCLDNGYASREDIERIEEHGRIRQADPSKVSTRAISRGIGQLGTLGSGNHYLEIQVVERILNPEQAQALGIQQGQVVIMVHCGSRGFGHQVATDYLKDFDLAMRKYRIHVKDRQLSCAPFQSDEGQHYYAAMACAANMAFANRQIITHFVRKAFADIMGTSKGMDLIYDVAHNIAKIEEHQVPSTDDSRPEERPQTRKVLVHRKGATRAFPPGHPELASMFKETGQPVLIGGSMETGSYLLTGTADAMRMSFGSTAHGAGRTMSRTRAKDEVRGQDVKARMEQRGIVIKAASMSGLAEEAGFAYKDIDMVIASLQDAGISTAVARMVPIGNLKG